MYVYFSKTLINTKTVAIFHIQFIGDYMWLYQLIEFLLISFIYVYPELLLNSYSVRNHICLLVLYSSRLVHTVLLV